MAGYAIRSLAQLAAEAKGAFVQAVQGTATKLWPNVWRVEAKVLSLIGFEIEQRRAWLVRQLFASTADEIWLRRHAFELGLTQDPAASAHGTATVSAPVGLVVPAGLRFVRGDGVAYVTIAAATASSTGASLPLEAETPASAGNADPGTVLSLDDADDAPTGLGTAATVDAPGLAGGRDAELLESFRARVLARKQRLAQGGSAPDYETWVREALGSVVQAVYVDSFQNDARSVWVAFTVLNLPTGVDRADAAAVLAAVAADPTILIPTPGQVAVAQDYIDDPVRRPVGARAFAVAPIASPVDVVIGGLSPDTLDIRAAVAAELVATFLDRAEPGRPSRPFTLSASWLDEAVSRATGEDRHRLVVPSGDQVFTAGILPVPGTVGYVN